nr:S-layer homology domain-containing protein [Cohnella sp. CFH 77786]
MSRGRTRVRNFTSFLACLSLYFSIVSPSLAASGSTAATTKLPFPDISMSYAKDAIVRLYDMDLIEGTGDGLFEPAKAITRAELVTMLDRLFALEPVPAAISAFADVPVGEWYYPWVQAATQLGIVTGTAEDKFGPASLVSRQDASVMISRALKQKLPVSGSSQTGYGDQDQIASYAVTAVLRMKELGVMRGDGAKFRPTASVTRQEAAVMMDNILQRSGWTSQIRSKTDMKIQLGWQYGQTTEQFQNEVLSSNVNTLSPRWYFLGKAGMSNTSVDASLLTWAHQHGKKVWAMVGNRSNRQTTHDMLSDAAKRNAVVTYLANEVKNKGIDGLNIDFENVDPQDRSTFAQFIADLAKALDAVPASLSVSLSPDTHSDWTDAYDYAALGKNADYIVLMGYDEHWNGGPAGSVSSLPWVTKGLDALLSQVPAAKAILAMPFYTRDWAAAGDSSSVTAEEWSLVRQNDEIMTRNVNTVWNGQIGQYTAEYTDLGKLHSLWLEDGRSLSAKAAMGEERAIAGYAYWYMGGESPDVWVSLRNAMRFSSYRF